MIMGLLGLCSCGESPQEPPLAAHETVQSNPQLEKGRLIWNGTCKVCHLQGIAGAPAIGDTKAWSKRIAKGKDTLYKHAILGYDSPEGNHMPPKGGNPELSEDEVKAAVDFVISASQ